MDVNDLDVLYTELMQALEGLELGWLAERVREQVDAGRIYTKDDVPVFKQSRTQSRFTQENQYALSAKGAFQSLETYSPKERAVLLIDAVQAAVDVILMENDIIQFSAGQNMNAPRFTTSDDREIVFGPTQSSSELASILKDLLVNLRREVEHVED